MAIIHNKRVLAAVLIAMTSSVDAAPLAEIGKGEGTPDEVTRR